MTDFIYDEECYPNIWTLGMLNVDTKERFSFEISHRRNDAMALVNFLSTLRGSTDYPDFDEYKPTKNRMVGFNSLGYDYPLLHLLINNPHSTTCETLYEKSQAIFSSDDRFEHNVWESKHFLTQIDVFKIHHFDNKARRTGLKDLEFNMQMASIQDLPFKPGTLLSNDQMDELIRYQFHDIDATFLFYEESLHAIKTREELSSKYNVNMLNYNDTKIGKSHFVRELEKASPGICFDRSSGRKVMRQTQRGTMPYTEIIFPYISFERSEFKNFHAELLTKEIIDTKSKDKTTVNVNGFDYVFGLGGLHGSVNSQVIRATEERLIIDIDVESYYPSTGIANKLYPEHLSNLFCDVYTVLKNERKKYTKKEPENALFKLALNGTYGASNDIYSPLYDPLYTMRTTINGQLLLAMLAEKLIAISGLEMIQANTDGLTFSVDKKFETLVMSICAWWERFTCMKLERADYSLMAIRDVNNYIAQYTNGKLKNKGCYVHDLEWHKNHSHKIVAKAAEAVLIHGANVREFICGQSHSMYDFMGKAKVPRNSKLLSVVDDTDTEEQRISRYFVSKEGVSLVKLMPPLNKALDVDPNAPWRRIGVAPTTGWKCTIINQIPREAWFWSNIDYSFYIEEVNKIVNPLIS